MGSVAARVLHKSLPPHAFISIAAERTFSVQENTTQPEVAATPKKMSIPARAGAAGKALLVYLGTGSIGAALVAYLLFKGMGC
jgi:hypothetical protein